MNDRIPLTETEQQITDNMQERIRECMNPDNPKAMEDSAAMIEWMTDTLRQAAESENRNELSGLCGTINEFADFAVEYRYGFGQYGMLCRLLHLNAVQSALGRSETESEQMKPTFLTPLFKKTVYILDGGIRMNSFRNPDGNPTEYLNTEFGKIESEWEASGGQRYDSEMTALVTECIRKALTVSVSYDFTKAMYENDRLGRWDPYWSRMDEKTATELSAKWKQLPGAYAWKARLDEARQAKEPEVLKRAEAPETPDVSVIIPVYNTEAYLRDCLDSVLRQTGVTTEIICINDGSTDSSPDILADYANRYSNITVLSQPNHGISVSRNHGMAEARGRYLHFMDSDDMMQDGAYEALVRKMDESNAEVLCFCASVLSESGVNITWNDNKYRRTYLPYDTCMSGQELFLKSMVMNQLDATSVMSMYRRSWICGNQLRFEAGILHEDNLFTMQVLLAAQRVIVDGSPYYIRRVREKSVMTSESRFDHVYGKVRVACCMQHRNGRKDDIPQPVWDYVMKRLRILLLMAENQYLELLDRKTDDTLYYLVLPEEERSLFEGWIANNAMNRKRNRFLKESRAFWMKKANEGQQK